MCTVERNGRCYKSSRLGAGNDKDESTRNKTGVGITRVPSKVTGLNTDQCYVQSLPHMNAQSGSQ